MNAFFLSIFFITQICLLTYIYILILHRSFSNDSESTKSLFNFKFRTKLTNTHKKSLLIILLNKFSKKQSFILRDITCFLKNRRIQFWFLLVFIFVYSFFNFSIDENVKFLLMTSSPIWMLIPLASNIFAFENGGLYLYFISPLKISEILYQKNIAIIVIGILFTIPILFLAIYLTQVSWEFILISIPILIYQFVSICILGTGVSIYFPNRVQYNKSTGQFNPITSQLYLSIGLFIVEGLLILLIIYLFNLKLILMITVYLLSFVMILLYNFKLKQFFEIHFIKRKSFLIKEIVKNEINIYE